MFGEWDLRYVFSHPITGILSFRTHLQPFIMYYKSPDSGLKLTIEGDFREALTPFPGLPQPPTPWTNSLWLPMERPFPYLHKRLPPTAPPNQLSLFPPTCCMTTLGDHPSTLSLMNLPALPEYVDPRYPSSSAWGDSQCGFPGGLLKGEGVQCPGQGTTLSHLPFFR